MYRALIRISSPHFVAGVEIAKGNLANRCAPILHYMQWWTLARIKDYCKSKGWQLEQMKC
jgi:hypothetical protein